MNNHLDNSASLLDEDEYCSAKEYVSKAVTNIEERYKKGIKISGLPTGFFEFDQVTTGLQAKDLIVIASRPSMGKSIFALNIAQNVALNECLPVAIFSMDISGEDIAMRMLSSIGGIDGRNLRSGDLTQSDWPRLVNVMARVSEARIFVDDSTSLTPDELRARSKRIKDDHGLAMIVVDCLQLMHVPGSKQRCEEISDISRSLKELAKELNVPVIALSQVNRSPEDRPDHRPKLSDLRGSGEIEQDADMVCFIYREGYYYGDKVTCTGEAEIIISKQRNGPTGKVIVNFEGDKSRFVDKDESFEFSEYPV